MKNCYFWATPSGPINLIKAEDMPVKPELGICSEEPRQDCYNQEGCICAKQWMPYHAALQRAKESSVPIQDQDRARRMIEQQQFKQRKELKLQCIESLDVMPDVFYGPFTVGYSFEWINPCIKNKACLKQVDGRPCPTNCQSLYPVAILYDDTPGKEPQEDNIEALRKELAEYTKAYNQECERNDAIRKDLEYWAQRSADLLKEMEDLRKTMKIG